MPPTRRMVTIALPSAVFARLDREAARRRVTKQALFAQLLTAYVAALPAQAQADETGDG